MSRHFFRVNDLTLTKERLIKMDALLIQITDGKNMRRQTND
jgi:hypothetical protein